MVWVAVVSLLAGGCSLPSKHPALKAMNIGMSEWVGYGPFYLGKDKGFFEEEGLDLSLVTEELDSARRDAMRTGMLDCEAGAINLLVTKVAAGLPIVSVCELDYSCGADGIVVSGDIKALEDLIGKRVVLARDDSGEVFLAYLFYKKSLPFDKLNIISASPEKVSQVFLSDEADAVVTWEPELSRSLDRPGSHVLVSTKEYPGVIIDTINVREDIVRDDPERVKALMRGWFKAVAYYGAHPVESSEIIAKYFKMTPEDYRKSVEGLKWIGYAGQMKSARQAQWIDLFRTIADIQLANGRISKKPRAEAAINTVLLKGLYETGK